MGAGMGSPKATLPDEAIAYNESLRCFIERRPSNEWRMAAAQDYPRTYCETLTGERFYYSDLIAAAERKEQQK